MPVTAQTNSRDKANLNEDGKKLFPNLFNANSFLAADLTLSPIFSIATKLNASSPKLHRGRFFKQRVAELHIRNYETFAQNIFKVLHLTLT
jgi:hypothetical protein